MSCKLGINTWALKQLVRLRYFDYRIFCNDGELFHCIYFRTFVTRSREMSHLSKISISIFLHHILITQMLHIDADPITIGYIWLQSYEGFVNAKNSIKQRNWHTVFANISKPISPTSDSFLLIMSHLLFIWIWPYMLIIPVIDFTCNVPNLFVLNRIVNVNSTVTS